MASMNVVMICSVLANVSAASSQKSDEEIGSLFDSKVS
jgi:hypothetical protein